jgi:hypothetical protein
MLLAGLAAALLQLGCGSSSFCPDLADTSAAGPPPAASYQALSVPAGTSAIDPPIQTAGPPTAAATLAAGSTLPAGITLAADWTLSIAPTAAPGSYAIGIHFCDAAGCSTTTAQVTVTGAGALGLSYATPNLVVGQTVAVSANLTGASAALAYSYALTGGALPEALVLNADGSISGPLTSAGASTFTITASEGPQPQLKAAAAADSGGGYRTASATLTWVVLPATSLTLCTDCRPSRDSCWKRSPAGAGEWSEHPWTMPSAARPRAGMAGTTCSGNTWPSMAAPMCPCATRPPRGSSSGAGPAISASSTIKRISNT